MKKEKLFSRKSPSEIVLYTIVFVIFCAFAFSYLYMIFWCAYSGMRDYRSLTKNPFGFSQIQLKNYIDVFTLLEVGDSNFFDMLVNSLYFSFFGTVPLHDGNVDDVLRNGAI